MGVELKTNKNCCSLSTLAFLRFFLGLLGLLRLGRSLRFKGWLGGIAALSPSLSDNSLTVLYISIFKNFFWANLSQIFPGVAIDSLRAALWHDTPKLVE